LDDLLAKSSTSTERHVLCYMDLDHFKVVNDVCGHAAGDELLKQIADIFAKTVRASDTLARVGGG
jgi:diguanylate cyclase (GGDEF)-like protein